jgi:hypothetical protein
MVPNKNDRKSKKHTAGRSMPRCASRPATAMCAQFAACRQNQRHVVAFHLLFCGTVRPRENFPRRASTLTSN